ncbi:flagellar basal body-associated protein FliL [Enterovirga aerilata]|uniref:Flagellar protein FliL n=1 Tax=Enterovirga aerilata TaxID=2730920 RepID=A0A849I5M3_9HYPH|nr:flagellar basal body-associated protein FliL [Enterovirga sp. DB1703]NNM71635.1 flagellar basal body-associated protein FliL [Enterovirga sp. DB1703]
MAKKPKEPSGDGAEKAGAPGGGGRKKLIVVVAAVLLLAGGAGGWFMMGRGARQAAVPEKKPVAFVDVREMTVNLAAEPNQDRPRFLKFKVALEVKDPKIVPEVTPLLPRVEDIFQVFVRELRASDLEGSGGIHRLREELLRRVNVAVAPTRVEAVLFKDVIVQ